MKIDYEYNFRFHIRLNVKHSSHMRKRDLPLCYPELFEIIFYDISGCQRNEYFWLRIFNGKEMVLPMQSI